MKIIKKYWPFLILIGSIAATYYVFFTPFTYYLTNNEKIIGTISFLGLGFAAFQFYISEININARRESDRRFKISNDIIKTLESIGESLNKELMNVEKNPLGIAITLMNQTNAFSTLILIIDETLFPGLTQKAEFKQINETVHKLNKKATEIYKSWPKEMKSINEPMHFAVYGIILKNNKEMVDLLQEFFTHKPRFYKLLYSYS